LSGRVDVVVVLELCHWKKVIPVILSFVHEDSEVLVQLLVDAFYLSVHLRVPSGRGDQPDSKKSIEFLSEEYDKLWTSV